MLGVADPKARARWRTGGCMPSIVAAMAARISIGLCPIPRRDVGKADRAALRGEDVTVSRGRVERLMRRHGLRGAAARRFRPVTTDVSAAE